MVSISSCVTREYTWHLQSLFLDDCAVEHAHDPVGLAADRDVVRDDEKLSPRSRLRRRISSTISAAFSESRSPVGSSAQTIAGSFTSERAMVTRWRSPPESSSGTWPRPLREPDQFERGERAAARLARSRRARRERKLDVLDRGQDGDQVVELEDEAHVPRAVVRPLAVGHVRQRGRPRSAPPRRRWSRGRTGSSGESSSRSRSAP